MDPTHISPWLLILTSAGVAAFVTSIVSFAAQFLERRSRRREVLLQKAMELAQARTDLAVRIAEKNGSQALLHDPVFSVNTYYRWLRHLLDHGDLPADAKQAERRSDEAQNVFDTLNSRAW